MTGAERTGWRRTRDFVRAAIGASGGLGYHGIAAMNARGLWAPFRAALGLELESRLAAAPHRPTVLVWIGPSGGYCVDAGFLRRFARIEAVDIDPASAVLLRRRFRTAPIRSHRLDFFASLEASGWDLRKWYDAPTLAEPTPSPGPGARASVLFLFSNLLGQLGFIVDPPRLGRLEEGLREAFRRASGDPFTNWLSFHDRISLRREVGPPFQVRTDRRWSTEELARAYLERAARRSGDSSLTPVEVEEHVLGPWTEEMAGEVSYLEWPITRHQVQLIELGGGSSGANRNGGGMNGTARLARNL